MKLLASLLITVSLICGSLAAATAYRASLSLPDEKLIGLTLSDPAGIQPPPETDADGSADPAIPAVRSLAALEARAPIARAGEELTPELLRKLRDADVRAVRVRAFSFARWQHGWVFGLSVLGLLGGAGLLRREAKRAGHAATDATGGAKIPDANEALRAAREGIAALRTELGAMPGGDQTGRRLALILARVSALQEGPLADFISARPRLIAKSGLSGYASVMDKFAGAERQVNRAWSAAADGYLEESEACLVESEPLFVEAIERLGA
jgi:hypothetical protein